MREALNFTLPRAWQKKRYNEEFNKWRISWRYIQENRLFTPMDLQYIEEMNKLISNK